MKKLLSFIFVLILSLSWAASANTLNDSSSTGGIYIDKGRDFGGGANQRLIITDWRAAFDGAQTGGTYPMRVVWPYIQFYDHYFKRWANSCNITSGSCTGRSGKTSVCSFGVGSAASANFQLTLSGLSVKENTCSGSGVSMHTTGSATTIMPWVR